MSERISLRYRLVALDLDGTVTPFGKPISERVLQAIARVQEGGVHIALVSGRMFKGILPFVQQLALTHQPVVCYGGSLIKQPDTGETLFEMGVPLVQARRVIEFGRATGRPVNVYLDDQVFLDKIPQTTGVTEWLLRIKAQEVGDLLAFLDRDPTHVAVVCDQSETKQVVLELRERFNGDLHITSGHPLLAEVDHPQVSKGQAVAWLAERFGVRREQVLAAGNDWNDVAMLEYAGLAVAMGGSPPEVLAVADVVAPPASEDGLADILERYVLRPVTGWKDKLRRNAHTLRLN